MFNLNMTCPQDVIVLGLSSSCFMFECNIKKIDIDTYIYSILSDLIECLGDDFKMNIFYKNYDNNFNHNILKFIITYNYNMWLTDFGIKVGKLKKTDIFNCKVDMNTGIQNYSENCIHYILVAKDGTYIDRKKTIFSSTPRTILDGWAKGSQVSDTTYKTIDF
jgi:hypothetical protein